MSVPVFGSHTEQPRIQDMLLWYSHELWTYERVLHKQEPYTEWSPELAISWLDSMQRAGVPEELINTVAGNYDYMAGAVVADATRGRLPLGDIYLPPVAMRVLALTGQCLDIYISAYDSDSTREELFETVDEHGPDFREYLEYQEEMLREFRDTAARGRAKQPSIPEISTKASEPVDHLTAVLWSVRELWLYTTAVAMAEGGNVVALDRWSDRIMGELVQCAREHAVPESVITALVEQEPQLRELIGVGWLEARVQALVEGGAVDEDLLTRAGVIIRDQVERYERGQTRDEETIPLRRSIAEEMDRERACVIMALSDSTSDIAASTAMMESMPDREEAAVIIAMLIGYGEYVLGQCRDGAPVASWLDVGEELTALALHGTLQDFLGGIAVDHLREDVAELVDRISQCAGAYVEAGQLVTATQTEIAARIETYLDDLETLRRDEEETVMEIRRRLYSA